MAAYPKLNLPRIEAALAESDVVVDGLYSWEEYQLFRERYGDDFYVVAVWSSPKIRACRLAARQFRPLTPEEMAGRDQAEIENVNKGGPIALADFTLVNESSLEALQEKTRGIISKLKWEN